MDTLEQLRRGHLEGAQRVKLSCGLTAFPREIFELADTLEVLDLSGNALCALPDDLHRLHKLKVIFCGDNAFEHLPESLGRCPQLSMIGFKANRITHVPSTALPPMLRWLVLTDNRIASLPEDIGRCTRLQKLMLAGNRLRELPPSLAHCHRLELLRISANHLSGLPAWLVAMPNLAWLAYAGNPFSDADEADVMSHTAAHRIDWRSLKLEGILGEGASGVIHLATWHRDGQDEIVAVKLFKGEMTSDGLPRSEMDACLAAGQHPNLIGVHGVIEGHPDGRQGLVMRHIPSHFDKLADPPSLASCTRDIYPPEREHELGDVLRLAHDIASVTAHLHQRGVMHGDLYAHNILWRPFDHALLGDFGAASFLPTHDEAPARALAAIEVKAFGCLLEELLARCAQPANPPGLLSRLHGLEARCSAAEPLKRPGMNAIRDELAQALSALS